MTFSAQTLRALDRIEAKAFRVMYTPAATPEAVAVYEAAANACWDYREAHGVLGLSWREIGARS